MCLPNFVETQPLHGKVVTLHQGRRFGICRIFWIYSLFTGYVTQPNFGRKNRLTILMRISKLSLIFIAAPWKFCTGRRNH